MCLFAPYLSSGQSALLQSAEALEELLAVERQIFEAEDDQKRSELTLAKSRIYSRFKAYDKALKTINRINTFGLPQEVSYELINEKALLQYLIGNHTQVKNAILEASLIDDYSPDDDTRLLEVLNYVALEEFDKAKGLYSQLKSEEEASKVFDVKRLKKVERAYNLSLVLPGSGQVYAGHFFKGLTSLGVQGALFAYGIQGIQNRYFFTQALPSIGIFQGFYFGGAEYARELVLARNQTIVQDLSKNIVNSFK